MRLKTLAIFGLIGGWLLLATTSWAVPLRSQVLGLLEGRHWQLNPQAFQKLGAGTELVLQELADNASLTNYLRFRALEALTFPQDETAAFLEAFSQRTAPTWPGAAWRRFPVGLGERIRNMCNALPPRFPGIPTRRCGFPQAVLSREPLQSSSSASCAPNPKPGSAKPSAVEFPALQNQLHLGQHR